jgi:hypothetical protein
LALKPGAEDKVSETDPDAGEGAKKPDPNDEGLFAKLRTHPIAVTEIAEG